MGESRDHAPSITAVTSGPIDLSKIRPGDEVTVRAIVHQADGENWGLHFKHLNGDYDGNVRHYVHPDCIVSHTPKALVVGDRVKVSRQYGAVVFTVVAIDEDMAWLRDSDHWRVQCLLSDLEREAAQ